MNQKEFEEFMRKNAHRFDVTVPKPGIYRYHVSIDFKPGGKTVEPNE